MSLQVWLPLNGDLHNQGLSKINLTTTPTFSTPGKISQSCLNSQVGWFAVPEMVGKKQMSFAYWVKLNSGTTTNWLDPFSWYSTDGSTNHRSRQEFYYYNTNGNTEAMTTGVWYYNQSNSGLTQRKIGQWYHYAFTINYATGITQFFIDGQLWKTTTNADTTHYVKGDGSAFLLRESALDCQINDFRLYDHILSVKEVEEISRGLVLHYKLNQGIAVNSSNLIPNSLNMPLGSANASTGTWRVAGTNNMDRSRVAISDTPDGNGYGFQNSGIQTANDGSCYGIDSFPTEANTIYTISMWARIISGTEGYAGFNIYGSTMISGFDEIQKNYRVTKLSSNGEWTKCSLTFLTNSATTRNIYIGITTGNTEVTTQMCNVHLEKSTLIDQNIIHDISGYNNNGDITKAVFTSVTKRYNNALVLNGTTVDNSSNTKIGAAYLRGFLSLASPSALTVSWWGKNDAYGRGGIFQTTVNADPSECTDYNTTAIANWDTTFRVYNGSTAVNFFSNFVKDSNWHYHTITYDGAYVKYFCDGVQKVNSALTGTLPSFNGFCMGLGKAGGVYRQIKQSIVDLRIYVTALSENQILELYNTSVTIDNKGNVYTREYIENDNLNITKTGIFGVSNVYDDNDLTTASIVKTSQQVQGNTIYEY